MGGPSKTEALAFIESVELPTLLETTQAQGTQPDGTPAFDFDKAKDQALVVGSDIISFVKGVTEDRRRDIVNSALLAQLAAKKQVPDPTDVERWYDVYFDVLTNIGWVIQDRQFVEHVHLGTEVEVHEAIMTVAASLLGPASGALALVKTTLDALKSMQENSPFITLFHRESQSARNAKFQVTLAEDTPDGQFLVTLMAFALNAEAGFTKVLVFKFNKQSVRIRHASGKVTINSAVLAGIRDALNDKVVRHAQDFVRGLPDL